MSKQESTAVVGDGEVSRKTGDFTYYAESYRNRIRSYRYKFTRDDAWRKKLHSLIFDDLMPVLVSLDKDWPLYVWNLRLRMQFCLRDQSDITTMKSFETFSGTFKLSNVARRTISECIQFTGGSNWGVWVRIKKRSRARSPSRISSRSRNGQRRFRRWRHILYTRSLRSKLYNCLNIFLPYKSILFIFNISWFPIWKLIYYVLNLLP